MNSLALDINSEEPQAKKLWFDDDTINVELTDGRVVSVPLSFYPILMNASSKVREDFDIFGEGTAIHFNALDEDLSVEALVMGRKQIPTLLRKD